MEFRSIERAPGAFQQPVTAGQIHAMCRRAFGASVSAVSAVELGNGMYNSTYRVDLGSGLPVILRVAPERPAVPHRAGVDAQRARERAVPRPDRAADAAHARDRLHHEIIGRDYLFQTMLDGVPAPDGLGAYPRPEWASFFRRMGTIARDIHAVRGRRFGPVNGPAFTTWSEAVIASLDDTAADLDDVGLDATDVRELAAAADRHRAVLDEITEPRLLHGDLWTVNVMIEPGAPEPTISGVFDCDRTSWGDPESDWTIFMAGRRPGTERDAFWETYGSRSSTPGAAWRALLYRARHLAAVRLERHRLGNSEAVPDTYDDLRDVLALLTA
ncbi:phosphotransferase family protein [Streptosporangium lutulentum]